MIVIIVPLMEYSERLVTLGKKCFCKTSFHLRIAGAKKKDRNKAEMKERKKTTGHLQKYATDVR